MQEVEIDLQRSVVASVDPWYRDRCRFENLYNLFVAGETRHGVNSTSEYLRSRARAGILQLDNIHFNPHRESEAAKAVSGVRELFDRLGPSNDQLYYYAFGKVKPEAEPQPDFVRAAMAEMRKAAAKSHKAELSWRCNTAAQDALLRGWYLIFQTLTVRPEHINEVFGRGSKCFSRYVEKITRSVKAECFGSVRAGAGENVHEYFAVVEHGSTTGHLHIHVLHMVKALPKNWQTDPNKGLRTPALRQLVMRPVEKKRRKDDGKYEVYHVGHREWLWPYGYMTPIALRTGAGDVWSRKLGWRWPVDRDTLQPIPAVKPGRVVGYIAKYLTKAYEIPPEKAPNKGKIVEKWKLKPTVKEKVAKMGLMERPTGMFRVRMTRGLGVAPIKKLVQEVGDIALVILSQIQDPSQIIDPLGHPLALRLVRKEATREVIRLMRPDVRFNYLRTLAPRPSIFEQLKSLRRTIQTSSTDPNTMWFAARRWKNTEIFDQELCDEIRTAWAKITKGFDAPTPAAGDVFA